MSKKQKQYFNLLEKDISQLVIQKKDNYTCQIIHTQTGEVFDGFKLAESQGGQAYTICEVKFQKSSTDQKYQPRLIFRRTDKYLQDKSPPKNKNKVRIPFEKGQDGYRKLWEMITLLYEWKKTVDAGDFSDVFAVTDKELANVIEKVFEMDDIDLALKVFDKISQEELSGFNDLINIKQIKEVLETWQNNTNSKKEVEFWQPFFKNNAWILSQIFSSSVNMIDDEFYVGGMYQGSREGGKITDFLVKDDFSDNVSVIEIKTPETGLVNKSNYNSRSGIYSMHADLTGSISQVLNQKDEIQKDYKHNNKDKNYNVLDPQCVLIIGKVESLTKEQEDCFNLFRRNQKNVKIITFDELFQRIKSILDILKENE